jgi:hypothetical protein
MQVQEEKLFSETTTHPAVEKAFAMLGSIGECRRILVLLEKFATDVERNAWKIKTEAKKGQEAMKQIYYLFDKVKRS